MGEEVIYSDIEITAPKRSYEPGPRWEFIELLLKTCFIMLLHSNCQRLGTVKGVMPFSLKLVSVITRVAAFKRLSSPENVLWAVSVFAEWF